MPSTIVGKKYRRATPNIPFYEDGKYLVRLLVPERIIDRADFQSRSAALREQAIDRFIMHYYPEYWPGVSGDLGNVFPDTPEYQATYEILRAQISEEVAVMGYYQNATPPLQHSFVVARYTPPSPVTVESIRKSLDAGTYAQSAQQVYDTNGELIGYVGLPPMEPVVEYFNSLQPDGGIVGRTSETTFALGTVLESGVTLADGMQRFMMQLLMNPPGATMNLDLSFFQADIQKFLSLFVQILVKQFNSRYDVQDFDEADTLTIYFGTYGDKPDKIAISAMEYLVLEESPQTKTMAVGYLTNMEYNIHFHDPLALSLMKNYNSVVEGMESLQQQPPGVVGNTGYSFLDFVDTVGTGSFMQIGGGQFNFEDNWDQFNFVKPITDNAAEEAQQGFVKAAREAGIPVNTQALSEGIEAALTSEEIRILKEKVLENPEIAAKVLAEQQATVLKAGIDVTSKLDQILTQGPLGFVKKNSPLDLVFRQFGISELAKEVFRCLTLGLAPEMARINEAVQEALTNQAGSIYLPPEQPKNEISVPDIDLETFKPFSLTGDIWKQLLKALLDGLRNAVLEVLKELSKMLNEACDFNNPFASDYGARDMTDYLPQGPGNIYGADPSAAALQNGPLNPQALYSYLQDLSSILSSLEICLLFTNRALVSQELISRIIDFNRFYTDPYVNTQLLTSTAIMSFFSELSQTVDVTSLCDEIIDGAYEINQENICLTEGDVATAIDAQNINSLLDLIQNGLQLDLPPVNFDCPDKAGFIENPLFSRTVPQVLNFTTEAVELQFINSTEAVLNILLEPDIVAGSNGGASTAAQASLDAMSEFLPVTETTSSQELNAGGMIQNVMTAFASVQGSLGDALGSEACRPLRQSLGLTQVEAVAATLEDLFSDPEFLNALTSISEKLENIATQISGAQAPGPNNMRATYSFPSNYLSNFVNYLSAGPTFSVSGSRVVSNYYEAISADEFLDTGSLGDWNPDLATGPVAPVISGIAGSAKTYQDLDLTFNFPTLGRQDSLTVSYPRFDNAVAMAGGEGATNLSFAQVSIQSSAGSAFLPPRAEFEVSSSVLDILDSHFYQVPAYSAYAPELGIQERLETNPYVYRFTGAVDRGLEPLMEAVNSIQQHAIIREEIETWLYPSLYAGLTKAMFGYISRNGIFDAAGVLGLQFFKDNSNCPPAAAADLLDGEGILNQVKAEFLEAACFDEDIPMDDKVRYAVLLSLFFNLIQIEVAEFVVKNIFTFAAFNVDELLDDPIIAQFMTSQILGDLERRLNNQPDVRHAIQEYYNRKIGRAVVAAQGGVLDYNEAVVFPVGTVFSDANWQELLTYLVHQRLHWSRTAVSNAVRLATPQGQFKKTFNEAFIEDVLGFTTLRGPSGDLEPGHNILSRTNGSPLAYGTLALERVVVWDGISDGDAPEALERTRETGGELELSEFRNTFYQTDGEPPYIEGSHNIMLSQFDFSFVGLRLKTRLVYFLPSNTQVHEVALGGGVEAEFFGAGASSSAPAVEDYTSVLVSRLGYIEGITGGQSLISLADEGAAEIVGDLDTLYAYENTGDPADAPLMYTNLLDDNNALALTPLIRIKIADFEIADDEYDAYLPLSDFTNLKAELDDWLSTGPLTAHHKGKRSAEITRIVNHPVYKQFFGETFIQSFITMVPMYQNFYLTERYFEKIEQTYGSPKTFLVESFLNVLFNREEQEAPGNTRKASAAAIQSTQGSEMAAKMESMGRDFILKMLIETPIMILKGLAEMIDPHVAIWKVVRNITGTAFGEIIKVIDASPVLDELPGDLTGEQVLGIMLCLVEFSMQTALETSLSNAPAPLNTAAQNQELLNNILPDFTLEGVDFTGKLTGMMMIPPLPFGILYILLELAKKSLGDALEGEDTAISGEESLPEC